MRFSDIVGQREIQKHLTEMFLNNRLSHALLFLGKEGSGALPLALAFAQYITCEHVNKATKNTAQESLFGDLPENIPIVSADSCGECSSCIKAAQLLHPDIHFCFPVIPKKAGSKPLSADFLPDFREFVKKFPYGNAYDWLQSVGAENKQGNITAEECNEIIRKLSLKSFESDYKILILWMPEYLRKEGNKLLKLIEEPPPKTLFILVAEEESEILPTILSRCQLVKIPPLHTADIQESLIKNAQLDGNKALQVAALAEGSYRKAIELLQHEDEDWEQHLRDWLNVVVQGMPAKQISWIEETAKLGRERQKKFLRYFSHIIEQSIRLNMLGSQHLLLSDNETDFAVRINKLMNIVQQQTITDELNKAIYYIERNANAKMLFHALTIKLRHIIKNKTLILAQ